MRKTKAIIAIILCFVLAVSLLAGCSNAPGKDGVNGKDGVDGITPHIGENGNWWIGDVDTGVKAAGQDGVDGKDGANGKNGADGITPHIGSNGNWWIGTKDTGVKAGGQNAVAVEYVTPEMFGAVGNGKTDDTAAVQSALKTGKPVLLCNTYRVKELDCTGLSEIVMYGKEDATARLSTFPVTDDTYNIIFEGKVLFKNAPERLSLEQIRFIAKNYGTLITTKVNGAWVKKCNFTNFGGVFMGGMKNLSQISENVFFQMRGTFATDCVDSIITNNYINSALNARTTLFTGTNFAGMYFQGNFVDYCKIAFGKYANWEFNRIEGNVFDSNFRVFQTETNFNDTTVTGNNFVRINRDDSKRASGLSEFGTYADDEMTNNPWTVFYIRGKCNRVNISGNSGTTEVALDFSRVNRPLNTSIDLSGVEGEIRFGYYNTSSTEMADIYVKDLDYITVDSLPSPLLFNTSGVTLTSFDAQHVIYQGNVYMNNNGTWVQLTNNAQQ